MTATETTYSATVPSPVGELLLLSDGDHLTGLLMGKPRVEPNWVRDATVLASAADQVRAYLAGELRTFDLPLRLDGTPFQRTVWAALCSIPYGETISYADLAARVGNPKASRAVGAANGRNRVCIVVPCHRVIAADGTLGGFGGGLWRKEWLLQHEAANRGAVAPVLSAAAG